MGKCRKDTEYAENNDLESRNQNNTQHSKTIHKLFPKTKKLKYFIKGEFNRTINIEYPLNYLTQVNDFEKFTQTPHTMHTY